MLRTIYRLCYCMDYRNLLYLDERIRESFDSLFINYSCYESYEISDRTSPRQVSLGCSATRWSFWVMVLYRFLRTASGFSWVRFSSESRFFSVSISSSLSFSWLFLLSIGTNSLLILSMLVDNTLLYYLRVEVSD